MTGAILKLEKIVKVLSNPNIRQAELVSTQEINQVCDALRNGENLTDKQEQEQLQLLILQVKARIEELHSLKHVNSIQLAVLMRLGKITRELKNNN